MKEYLTQLKEELAEMEKCPFAFKGILNQYNFDDLSEEELSKVLYKEGVIKNIPISKLKDKVEEIDIFSEYELKNPILYYEFILYCKVDILNYTISHISSYWNFLVTGFEYLVDHSHKKKYLQSEINEILKKIDNLKGERIVFSLLKDPEYLEYFTINILPWLDGIDYDDYPNSGRIVEEVLFSYLKASDKCKPQLNKLYAYSTWREIELYTHKLEFIKSLLDNLKKIKKRSTKNKEFPIIDKNQRFLEGFSKILIDENDILIFEDVIKLPQAKNIPFFTAVYNYFGTGKKKFNIDSPKIFFDLVNESYHLKMKRLRGTDMPKYTNLEKVFKKILEKWENYN